MKNDLVLALRNLLRNRRRSLSTLLALAIGLSSILLFGGFKTNIRYSLMTNYVRTGGHLQIQHRDFYLYGSGNPTAYGIASYEELIGAIAADAELKPLIGVVTPKLQLGGVAGNFDAGVSRTVLGTGLVAEQTNRMRRWNEFNVRDVHAPLVLEGAGADAAIVGIGVARVLQVCEPLRVEGCGKPTQLDAMTRTTFPADGSSVSTKGGAGRPAKTAGSALPADIAALAALDAPSDAKAAQKQSVRIDLLASSGRGAPNVAALNVVAAQDQGFKELDEVSVILHLPFAQRLVFGRSPTRVTAIMLQLNKSSDLSRVSSRLAELLKARAPEQALVVRDFQELNPFYVQSIELFDVIFGFIFVLIGGIVLFTVGNTMNAAVVERTVEIGTLRAIGLRQAGIRRLFVLEGFLIGCCGAVAGIIAAVILAEVVNHSGLTWLPPSSSTRLPLQLRVLGETVPIVATAVALVLIATFSAWLPAWRAARLNVVEALRHA